MVYCFIYREGPRRSLRDDVPYVLNCHNKFYAIIPLLSNKIIFERDNRTRTQKCERVILLPAAKNSGRNSPLINFWKVACTDLISGLPNQMRVPDRAS